MVFIRLRMEIKVIQGAMIQMLKMNGKWKGGEHQTLALNYKTKLGVFNKFARDLIYFRNSPE